MSLSLLPTGWPLSCRGTDYIKTACCSLSNENLRNGIEVVNIIVLIFMNNDTSKYMDGNYIEQENQEPDRDESWKTDHLYSLTGSIRDIPDM